MLRVAVAHPIDPAGHVPSGIDAFIRGVLKFAPADVQYTLFGASSDPLVRPVGQKIAVSLGGREVSYWPLVSMDPTGKRGKMPLIIRFMWALRKVAREGGLADFDILDFHRIEPLILFGSDTRPKNVLLHQDMSVIRNKDSDILWRHMPWAYEAIERRLFQQVDTIFTVRQSAVVRYAELYPQLKHRFRFIPTWVDTTVFRPDDAQARAQVRSRVRRDLGIAESARLLIFVGRLDQQKNPLLLLEAFRICRRSHPDLHLMMVGDGGLRSKVEASIQSAGLQGSVNLLGVRSPAQIAVLLRGADCFFMSSAYEGMPIAVLEALATGLPVVTTDVGEIRLVVQDGVNGAISASQSTDALSTALLQALDRLEAMHGVPSARSVEAYHPGSVLNIMYENHRRQGAQLAAAKKTP